jgi:hypothetical protein
MCVRSGESALITVSRHKLTRSDAPVPFRLKDPDVDLAAGAGRPRTSAVPLWVFCCALANPSSEPNDSASWSVGTGMLSAGD